jgi:hypothetical protein
VTRIEAAMQAAIASFVMLPPWCECLQHRSMANPAHHTNM